MKSKVVGTVLTVAQVFVALLLITVDLWWLVFVLALGVGYTWHMLGEDTTETPVGYVKPEPNVEDWEKR